MSQTAQIPAELTERLKDEVHAQICHQAYAKQLAEVTAQAQATRSPFAFLRSRKSSRTPFEVAEDGSDHSEQSLQERIHRVEHIRSWAGDRIREQLDLYLLAASQDYQAYHNLPQLVQRWRATLQGVSELMTAFAREVRALVAQNSDREGPAPSFEAVRKIVVSLGGVAGRNQSLVEEFARLRHGRLAPEIVLPTLPALPTLAWLDPLARKGLPGAAKELKLAETAAREFIRGGRERLIAQCGNIEPTCASAKASYLERYWSQLREHTRQYHVSPDSSPEELMSLLEQRHHAVEQRRQHVLLTNSPFSLER